MTDARGPFRHAPNEPKDFLAEMQARTSQGGDRYLFGFGGGKKWLLFLDKRKTAAEGEECWRLYSQDLAPKRAPEQQPGPTRPREMFVCDPDRPEPFVSGLPDWPRR
jgi:hypothetical protein